MLNKHSEYKHKTQDKSQDRNPHPRLTPSTPEPVVSLSLFALSFCILSNRICLAIDALWHPPSSFILGSKLPSSVWMDGIKKGDDTAEMYAAAFQNHPPQMRILIYTHQPYKKSSKFTITVNILFYYIYYYIILESTKPLWHRDKNCTCAQTKQNMLKNCPLILVSCKETKIYKQISLALHLQQLDPSILHKNGWNQEKKIYFACEIYNKTNFESTITQTWSYKFNMYHRPPYTFKQISKWPPWHNHMRISISVRLPMAHTPQNQQVHPNLLSFECGTWIIFSHHSPKLLCSA